jgi:hypothetical protein
VIYANKEQKILGHLYNGIFYPNAVEYEDLGGSILMVF